ncbi:MAG TPA: aminotransferase class I/II-fold pyridoxal phosphate-dependent enzyme [Thermomicrobiales bacterium]
MPIATRPDRMISGRTVIAERTSLRSRAVRGREGGHRSGEPLSEPIYQTAAYGFADSGLADEHFAAGRPVYARDGLPNVRSLERVVADLERAEAAVAVSSGMAAIALVLFTQLAAGDHVIAPADCYRDTTALLADQFARFGVAASFVDPNDATALRAAVTPRTRLIFVETIANPGMTLTDLPAVATVARECGLVLCVDNTFATPALCRPIEHGADLVVHSAGKFLAGHDDVTAGVVVGRHALIEPIRRAGYLLGPTLAPMDAWLTVRGLKTLPLRMSRISRTASAVASFLWAHPAVAALRYPGCPLPQHPGLVNRVLPDGGGGVMAVDLAGGPAAADRFIRNLRAIPYAPTVGGTSTIVSYPPQPETFDADGLRQPRRYRSATVRLSIGLEDPEDVIADLDQALTPRPVAFGVGGA